MQTHVTAENVVALLNDLNTRDPRFMRQLFQHAPRCNAEVADHPTVQVRRVGNQFYAATVLGLLNGLFGVFEDGPKVGYGAITAIWSEDGKELINFEVTENA